jgi:hypothetical protein
MSSTQRVLYDSGNKQNVFPNHLFLTDSVKRWEKRKEIKGGIFVQADPNFKGVVMRE